MHVQLEVCSAEAHLVNCRYNELKLTMFQHTPFPCLKGKAAEVRNFVPALRHALACIGIDETRHHEKLMKLQVRTKK